MTITTATIVQKNGTKSRVHIDYVCRGGCHVYTSQDIPGLLAASRSHDEIVRDLPELIAGFLKMSKGTLCDVFIEEEQEESVAAMA